MVDVCLSWGSPDSTPWEWSYVAALSPGRWPLWGTVVLLGLDGALVTEVWRWSHPTGKLRPIHKPQTGKHEVGPAFFKGCALGWRVCLLCCFQPPAHGGCWANILEPTAGTVNVLPSLLRLLLLSPFNGKYHENRNYVGLFPSSIPRIQELQEYILKYIESHLL